MRREKIDEESKSDTGCLKVPGRGRGRQTVTWPLGLVCAVITGAGWVVVAVLVAVGATRGVDVAARDFFRPHDEWGSTQLRADIIVEGLRPIVVSALLLCVATVTSALVRSWRPLLFAGTLGMTTCLITFLTKLALHRPDPHYQVAWDSGSFPSGHVVAVLVTLGGIVLIVWERTGWRHWLMVAVGGIGMSWALLVEGAHWFTDVLGGVLLSLAILAVFSTFPLRRSLR